MSRYSLAKGEVPEKGPAEVLKSQLELLNIKDTLFNLTLEYQGDVLLLNGDPIDEKTYDDLNKRAEVCALIAQRENPEDIRGHAVKLMSLSMDELFERWNKVSGLYRGLKVKNG